MLPVNHCCWLIIWSGVFSPLVTFVPTYLCVFQWILSCLSDILLSFSFCWQSSSVQCLTPGQSRWKRNGRALLCTLGCDNWSDSRSLGDVAWQLHSFERDVNCLWTWQAERHLHRSAVMPRASYLFLLSGLVVLINPLAPFASLTHGQEHFTDLTYPTMLLQHNRLLRKLLRNCSL